MAKTVFCACLLFLLGACGGGDDGSSCTSNPAPAITSSPPAVATAGTQYRYHFDFTMGCIPFFTACGVDLLQGPPGAGIDQIRDAVYWDPVAANVGTSQRFTIATKPDLCGNRASQSWTVTVQ